MTISMCLHEDYVDGAELRACRQPRGEGIGIDRLAMCSNQLRVYPRTLFPVRPHAPGNKRIAKERRAKRWRRYRVGQKALRPAAVGQNGWQNEFPQAVYGVFAAFLAAEGSGGRTLATGTPGN